MKRFDVICLGEVLVDLISQEPGKRLADVALFRKFAGGAPANVAIGLAKLGCTVAFAGKIGNDSFGSFLKNYLERNGVDIGALIPDPEHRTRLAFVEIAENGERDFEFSEKIPADSALSAEDFSMETLNSARIVHLGSLPLTAVTGRRVFRQLINRLDSERSLTSFDPNYRPSLWQSPGAAKKILRSFAKQCRILKMNLEEAAFLSDSQKTVTMLKDLFFPKTHLLAITLGAQGCILKNRRGVVEVPGFRVDVADSTGCGDAFLSGLLACLIRAKKAPEDLNADELFAFGQMSNAVAALTATRFGATDALPTNNELDIFINRCNLEKEVISK
ncbi:MAG: carbohydrate kinase [Candidatus Neomarinimicrobiota bacterium]